MVLSTFEIVMVILLTIGLGISIFFYITSYRYGKYINQTTYTRGANVSGEGKTVNLSCDADKKISIDKAVQICTNPDDNNFESSNLEPFSSGLDSSNVSYGDFNPDTTVDITSVLENVCNGKNDCSYRFTPSPFPGNVTCNGIKQLIATYDCVPK